MTIIEFLKQFPQVKPTSSILLEKGWDQHKTKLTSFYSGSRHVFVEFPVSLNIVLENIHCRLWHPTQTNFCQRCQKVGHKTNDHTLCRAYVNEPVGILFRSYKDPLNNFYNCELKAESYISIYLSNIISISNASI